MNTRTKPRAASRTNAPLVLLLLLAAGSVGIGTARADVDPHALSPSKSKLDHRAVPDDVKKDEAGTEVVSIGEGRRLADAKKFDESARVLRKVLELNPENDDARSLLARVLAWGRKFDESIAEYQKILREHPNDNFERAGYARVLAWSGRAEESLAQFRIAAGKDSTDFETRIGYARALSWAGDLPGASMEYEHILDRKPAYGDAWLGIATVARWRGAPTASAWFVSLAETRGADKEGIEEEKNAIRLANSPSLGGGWTTAHERQYVEGPDYSIESTGPYVTGRRTFGSSGVTGRWSSLDQFEVNQGASTSGTTLNYDVDMTVLRADVAYLRNYPFQITAGLEGRWLKSGSPNVIYPLSSDKDNFFGWSSHAWWYLGRWTPGVQLFRTFIPIKTTTGTPELEAGHQTVLSGELGYQWNARWSATVGVEGGSYSDDNRRGTVRGGAAWRFRLNRPSMTADYNLSFTDFDATSSSYFTPLQSVRNAVGVGLAGASEKIGLDYGARYQMALVTSSNFEDIATHTISGWVNVIAFDAIPVGLEGAYSNDNNNYETWYLGVSASGRW
ncbi:MAG TPA: tetratricopeptide repeat protein [Candidatus Eisenbacteria bacterium]|nr:tetratricopeptide repeat protein [Candidatus Eisenbacteria bacterium]